MEQWKKKIENKTVRVGILGLGYVGLPLAMEFAHSGVNVIGFDIDDKKVKILNSGKSIIKNHTCSTMQNGFRSRIAQFTVEKISKKRKDDDIS